MGFRGVMCVDAPALAPVEAVARLAGGSQRFLLHSASDADGCGRYSFAGVNPQARLRLGAASAVHPFAALEAFAKEAGANEPVDALELAELAELGPVPRVVGFLGYDVGRRVERLPVLARDDLGLPDLCFARYDAIWRCDHQTGRAQVVGTDPAAVAALLRQLASGPVGVPALLAAFSPLVADQPDAEHARRIERALAYIRAGDVYQVNLARRLRAAVRDPALVEPLAVYAAIARGAPSPYGALFEYDDFALLSNSPEMFLRREPGAPSIQTRPIKGTVARGRDRADDERLGAELMHSRKERAEHLMIVDLERNDLGRVSEVGSVTVEDFARLLSLPTVQHLVSTVAGRLREDVGLAELLTATFPGGSITGAPKVRAMQIIEELEPVRRGAYTGAIGFVGLGGQIELSIAIRTAVLVANALYLHVGGGIVADSSPDRELAETEEKALAWRRALGTAR